MMKMLEELSYRDLEILNLIQKQGPITKKKLQDTADMKLTTLDNRVIFSKGGQFQGDAIAIGAAAMMLEFYLKSIKINN